MQHEPLTSTEDAILRGSDIKSTTQIVEMSAHRMLVADTDTGRELKRQIADLEKLLYAYRHGFIKPATYNEAWAEGRQRRYTGGKGSKK